MRCKVRKNTPFRGKKPYKKEKTRNWFCINSWFFYGCGGRTRTTPCCGTLYFRRRTKPPWKYRPLHTKPPRCICRRQRGAAWARLSPTVRVRPVQRINPIVNVSFTMGFIGAANRTRTGTSVTSRDFKSLVSTYSTTAAYGDVTTFFEDRQA